MTIILHDIEIDDFILAARAVRKFLNKDGEPKDAIIAYTNDLNQEVASFYLIRNKRSVTVRKVQK